MESASGAISDWCFCEICGACVLSFAGRHHSAALKHKWTLFCGSFLCSAFQADALAAGALKEWGRWKSQVATDGTEKPITVTLRNHSPELAALNTKRTASGCCLESPRHE